MTGISSYPSKTPFTSQQQRYHPFCAAHNHLLLHLLLGGRKTSNLNLDRVEF